MITKLALSIYAQKVKNVKVFLAFFCQILQYFLAGRPSPLEAMIFCPKTIVKYEKTAL